MGEAPASQSGESLRNCGRRSAFYWISRDQIDSCVVKDLFYGGEGAFGLVRRIGTPHRGKRRVVQRLHAHGYSIDSAVPKFLEKSVADIQRMKLNSELVRINKTKKRAEAAQRRRPAAEVDRAEPTRAGKVS